VKARRRAPWWVVVCDTLVISASMVLAYVVRYELRWFRDISYYHPPSAHLPFGLVFVALTLLTFQVDQVYQYWCGRPWLDHVYRIINAMVKSVVIMLAITFIFQPLEYSRLLLAEAGVIAIILLALSRMVQKWAMGWLRTRGIGVARAIIVGAGEVGRTVMRTVVARPELGYQVVGFVDDNPEKGQTDIGRFKALGPLDNLSRLITGEAVDEVIITLPWMYHRKIMGIVHECERRHVSAHIVPDLFQMSLSHVDVDDLGGVPLIGVRAVGFDQGALLVKRGMDFLGALMGLTLGAPLLGLIALAIRIDSPGPILFRQARVGAGGQLFEIYKFRSMRVGAEDELEESSELRKMNEADGPLFKIRDDPRLTRVGRFLRRTSLDELPQLWNVWRGEMSLVGPRPPIPAEVGNYMEWHKKRLEVRPGMTGMWQVSGRSLLSFDEMVLLDIYYIENWSLWLDLKILLRTIPKVVFGEGAY
jgi:exopolysaccharide biosynthesis polyprenyl glycosylphosphotransferase